MPSKTKKPTKAVSFDEYKAIKDEIIEISKHRFENILTKRLTQFKNSLMSELEPKFDAIDIRFDAMDKKSEARFDSLEKRINLLTWLLPLIISFIMAAFKFI